MSHRRNRTKQTRSLPERLMKAAADARARAEALEPGKEKHELLEKARQFEAQIGMNDFLETPSAQLT